LVTCVQGTRLHLLDGFELRTAGVTVELRPASQRVLAFLALAGKSVGRSYTAFRLWPDKSEDRALANLRSALWRLPQQRAPLVEATPLQVRLHHDIWVDARDGIRELRDAALDEVIGDRHDATVSGELLPEWYDDWIVVERERLRQLRVHALEEACGRLLAQGRVPDAIDVGLRAVSMEPLRESAHRLVIEAHLAEGNVGEALRQYERCRRQLEQDLGVRPSNAVTALLPVDPETLAGRAYE
jgi:DNA-binding SARP family transcriptional activator